MNDASLNSFRTAEPFSSGNSA